MFFRKYGCLIFVSYLSVLRPMLLEHYGTKRLRFTINVRFLLQGTSMSYSLIHDDSCNMYLILNADSNHLVGLYMYHQP